MTYFFVTILQKEVYTNSMRAIVGWSVVDDLHKILTPTLIISADEDYSFVGDKERYLKMLPNAEMIVVEDSRHATPVEHPDAFNQIVFAFLLRQV